MLDRHVPPVPDQCEVCSHAIEQGLDVENEHALARLATLMLLDELATSNGRPIPWQSVAVSAWDPGVGVVHVFSPRHWHWALFFEPDVGVALREGRR